VEAGTGVVYSAYAMNRNPDIWPDPLSFKPERWLDDNGEPLKEVSPYKFVTFNAGPRMCLGKNLAYMEIKVVLSMLLNKFDIAPHGPPHSGEYVATLVLPMKGGLKVVATRRADNDD
jgi:fatty acid omega-hydroxylase